MLFLMHHPPPSFFYTSSHCLTYHCHFSYSNSPRTESCQLKANLFELCSSCNRLTVSQDLLSHLRMDNPTTLVMKQRQESSKDRGPNSFGFSQWAQPIILSQQCHVHLMPLQMGLFSSLLDWIGRFLTSVIEIKISELGWLLRLDRQLECNLSADTEHFSALWHNYRSFNRPWKEFNAMCGDYIHVDAVGFIFTLLECKVTFFFSPSHGLDEL